MLKLSQKCVVGIKKTNILAVCTKDPRWNRRQLYRNDTTPSSDFTFIFNIFLLSCVLFLSPGSHFSNSFYHLQMCAAPVGCSCTRSCFPNFQPSISSPSPFQNVLPQFYLFIYLHIQRLPQQKRWLLMSRWLCYDRKYYGREMGRNFLCVPLDNFLPLP